MAVRTVADTYINWYIGLTDPQWATILAKMRWYFRTAGAKPPPASIMRAFKGSEPSEAEWALLRTTVVARRRVYRATRKPLLDKAQVNKRNIKKWDRPPGTSKKVLDEDMRRRMREFQKRLPELEQD